MKALASLDERQTSLRALQTIPGIGPSLAKDLYSLGIRRVTDLKRRSPEKLYRQLEQLTGAHQDRCVLYTFRCAVYFAETPSPEPERLRWWNWKDTPARSATSAASQSAAAPRKSRRPPPRSG